MDDRALQMWVIYRNPKDWPGAFVVREWRVTEKGITPCRDGFAARDLETARSLIPAHAVRLDRDPNDDPAIAEVWL